MSGLTESGQGRKIYRNLTTASTCAADEAAKHTPPRPIAAAKLGSFETSCVSMLDAVLRPVLIPQQGFLLPNWAVIFMMHHPTAICPAHSNG